jgi:hypothetical protein
VHGRAAHGHAMPSAMPTITLSARLLPAVQR